MSYMAEVISPKLSRIIKGLSVSNPRLSDSLKKWRPLLTSTVGKICYVTKKNPDDVLQEILTVVSEVESMYDVDLYRYQGSVYEFVEEAGNEVVLRTPRFNKREKKEIRVDKNLVLTVEKGKFRSAIYREIQQCSCDIINSYFTKKNGFKKVVEKNQLVKVSSASDGVKQERRDINKVEKFVDVMSLDGEECSPVCDFSSAEDNVIFLQYVNEIADKISEEGSIVLKCMMENPGISVNALARELNLFVRKVKYAKCEIERAIPFLQEEKIPGIDPIYVKANEILDKDKLEVIKKGMVEPVPIYFNGAYVKEERPVLSELIKMDTVEPKPMYLWSWDD